MVSQAVILEYLLIRLLSNYDISTFYTRWFEIRCSFALPLILIWIAPWINHQFFSFQIFREMSSFMQVLKIRYTRPPNFKGKKGVWHFRVFTFTTSVTHYNIFEWCIWNKSYVNCGYVKSNEGWSSQLWSQFLQLQLLYAIAKIAIITARIILHLISYPQFTYDLFHMHHSPLYLSREHMNPKLTCSQRQWLHSSVGRASHRYREVTGSSPVEVLNFFQASLRNCKNCDHNCEDHPSFDIISLSLTLPNFNSIRWYIFLYHSSNVWLRSTMHCVNDIKTVDATRTFHWKSCNPVIHGLYLVIGRGQKNWKVIACTNAGVKKIKVSKVTMSYWTRKMDFERVAYHIATKYAN